MKKILTLIVLSSFTIVTSQTKLVSHHLDLKKPKASQQLLNVVNPDTEEVYTLASDKESTTVLRFNSALFFSDSLTVKRPDKQYTFMAGFSIENKQSPYVYWASEDFDKILAVQYDFQTKKATEKAYTLPLQDETVLATFSENSSFYILCNNDKAQKLELYVFKNGNREQKTFDFENTNFITAKGKTVKLNSILQDYPIQSIDTKSFNSLLSCTQKTKLYITANKLVLTFDHNPKETQLFEINLDSYGIAEYKIAQPQLKAAATKSNSFFDKDLLYQLKYNESELALYAKNITTNTVTKSFTVTQNDTIAFKTSPLYSQTGEQRPKQLKSTKKFLDKLSTSEPGISVYHLNGNLLLTIGGAKSIATTGMIVLGVAASVGSIMTGTGGDMSSLLEPSTSQVLYFESFVDNAYQTIKTPQGPLAVDFISEFMEQNDEAYLNNTFVYKDFYILGYYDSESKQYVMRKFADEGLDN